ncbi:MAG: LysM peptidoglycan-binding domain-containing protein [Aridibacter sp.]
MRKINITKFFVGLFALVFVFGTMETFAQRRADFKVEAGQKIRVRMEDEINSKVSRVGDRFDTRVVEPVYSSTGVVVIPVGSTVVGRVDTVRKAKKGGDPGTIDVSFTQVRLPDGKSQAINGSLTNLDTKSAKSDNEGAASGDDRENDKIIFVGGGAAGGAILGGIIGGGKGALIGGILGGVGGLLGERLTKGEDARVKAGTEFGVYINRAFYLSRYNANDPVVNNDRNDDRYERRGTAVNGRTYVVRPGDTLGKISVRFYGTSRRYMDIYNANRNVLASPNSVAVGQTLIIP